MKITSMLVMEDGMRQRNEVFSLDDILNRFVQRALISLQLSTL